MPRRIEKHRPSSLGRAVILAAGVLLSCADGGALCAAETAAKRPAPFELGYLSDGAQGFVACRPSVWFKQPGMAQAAQKLDQATQMLALVGIAWPKRLRPEHIEQIVADINVNVHSTGKSGRHSLMIGASNIFIRMDEDFDWPACFKNLYSGLQRCLKQDGSWKDYHFENIKKVTHEGMTVYRLGVIPMMGGVPVYAHMPDRRSVVISFLPPKNGEAEFRHFLRGAAAARKRDWGSGLSKVQDAALAIVLDNHNGYYAKTYAKDLDKKDVKVLKNIRFAALSVELGEGKPVRAVLDAKSAETVPVLEKALHRYRRVALTGIREAAAKDKADNAWTKLVTDLAKTGRVHRDGGQLEWLGFSSIRIHDLIEAMPASGPQTPPAGFGTRKTDGE